MKQEDKSIEQFKKLIGNTKTIAKDIAVIIVANSKAKKDRHDDYTRHSISTGFFAERELEEIISGFQDNGIEVTHHQSEMDFIKWVINGGLNTIHRKFKIVYNNASSGKGPGRKSLIPAFCNLNHLQLISSDPYVVSLARHKYHCASILGYNKISTPASWYYLQGAKWLSKKQPPIGTMVIAKPTYESASIGIDENSIFEYSIASDDKLDQLSQQFEQPITVQEFIPGYEVEVPVIIQNRKPLTIHPIGLRLEKEKLLGNKILNYDMVYSDAYQFYRFDEFGETFNKKLLKIAQQAMIVIGTEGYGRIDFRITEKGKAYIMDVATYPHLIKHSSFWYLFKECGFEYKDIFSILLAVAAEKYKWLH